MIQDFSTAWYVPTYNCNNACAWCYAASNLTSCEQKSMPWEFHDPILDLLKSIDISHVILIGGEPTVYPNLPKLVKKISSRDINTGLVTNGRKLRHKDYARTLQNNGLGSLCISIEGHNAELHDATTQTPGSFAETVGGIERCLSFGIKTSTNTTISTKNINTIEKMVDFLEEWGLDLVTFNVCGVCIQNPENSEYTVSPSEGVKAFQRIYQHAKDKKIKIRLVTPSPKCLFDQEILQEMERDHEVIGACHSLAGKNFVVDYNGDILSCTHMSGFPFFNVFLDGRIMIREEFIEAYNDPEGIPVRYREKVRRFPSQKCDDNICPGSCTGGCPVTWSKYDPEKVIVGFK